MAQHHQQQEAEPIANLKANGDGKKWGQGVNPEYEKYRVDSDGDGLSDRWEIANNRDPQDGLLYFSFDCGGWQTEGWESKDISSNLAGSLGYLDKICCEISYSPSSSDGVYFSPWRFFCVSVLQ